MSRAVMDAARRDGMKRCNPVPKNAVMGTTSGGAEAVAKDLDAR